MTRRPNESDTTTTRTDLSFSFFALLVRYWHRRIVVIDVVFNGANAGSAVANSIELRDIAFCGVM